MRKRILSMVLVLCMCLSLLPTAAFAGGNQSTQATVTYDMNGGTPGTGFPKDGKMSYSKGIQMLLDDWSTSDVIPPEGMKPDGFEFNGIHYRNGHWHTLEEDITIKLIWRPDIPEVNRIDATVIGAEIGKTPKDLSVIVPSGAHYTGKVKSVERWSDHQTVQPDDTFCANTEYSVIVTFTLTDGYIAAPTVGYSVNQMGGNGNKINETTVEVFTTVMVHENGKVEVQINPGRADRGQNFPYYGEVIVDKGTVLNLTEPASSYVIAPENEELDYFWINGVHYNIGDTYTCNNYTYIKLHWKTKPSETETITVTLDANGGTKGPKFPESGTVEIPKNTELDFAALDSDYLTPPEGKELDYYRIEAGRSAATWGVGGMHILENDVTIRFIWKEKTPEVEMATATFKVENGTWNGTDTADKTVEVALTDGKGTLAADQIPTTMKPAEGYEGGAWNVTPNTTTDGITGNVTYTYSFTKKAELIPITEVSLTGFTAPVYGATPDFEMSVPQGAPYHFATKKELDALGCYRNTEQSINGIWWRGPDGSMTEADTFTDTSANAYRMNLVLIPNPSYTFAEKVSITINGDTKKYYRHYNDKSNMYILSDDFTVTEPAESKATVTFKVENGTWDGMDTADKTVEVSQTNGKGTLDAVKVPTGMKHAEGYEGGAWDVPPNTTKDGITGNVTYTYRFTKKDEQPDQTVLVEVTYSAPGAQNVPASGAVQGKRKYEKLESGASGFYHTLVVSDVVPTRNNDTFVGWEYGPYMESQIKVAKPGDTIKIAPRDSVTLTAKWINGPKTVTVKGGEAAISVFRSYDDYTKNHYEIDGDWSSTLSAKANDQIVFRVNPIPGKVLLGFKSTTASGKISKIDKVMLTIGDDFYYYENMPNENITVEPIWANLSDDISVLITPPAIGKHPDTTAEKAANGEHYNCNGTVKWFTFSDGVEVSEGDAFEVGEEYIALIPLKLDAGYAPGDSSKVYINGLSLDSYGKFSDIISGTEGNIVRVKFPVLTDTTSTPQYSVAVSANLAEGGTVIGSGSYAQDADVTLKATAKAGWHFVQWTENGNKVSDKAEYSFKAVAERTLVAVFEQDTPTGGSGDSTPVEPEEHTHAFGDSWKNDATNHWHECSCGEKNDVTAHAYEWIIDKEATETMDGVKHQHCTVCGYNAASVTIPATKVPQDKPVVKPVEKIEPKPLNTVPEGLKNTNFNTVEKIKQAMEEVVLTKIGEKNTGNEQKTIFYDAVLMITENGVARPATKEEVEARGGITVVIPYPAGTNKADYVFTVAHMLTIDMAGMQAGDIETPEITLTDAGLQVTLKGLSPVMVGYSKKAAKAASTEPTVPETTVPNTTVPETTVPSTTVPTEQKEMNPSTEGSIPRTGEESNILLWSMLCLVSACGLTGTVLLKKKRNSVR